MQLQFWSTALEWLRVPDNRGAAIALVAVLGLMASWATGLTQSLLGLFQSNGAEAEIHLGVEKGGLWQMEVWKSVDLSNERARVAQERAHQFEMAAVQAQNAELKAKLSLQVERNRARAELANFEEMPLNGDSSKIEAVESAVDADEGVRRAIQEASKLSVEATEASRSADLAASDVKEIVRETFGHWEVRCAPDGTECFMYQLARDSDDAPVAEVSVLKLPTGGEAIAGVTVVTPLGTLLPNGVILQVDDGEQRQYPFAWCSQLGCFSRFGLDQFRLDNMKTGKVGKITVVSVGSPDKPVALDLSLGGFGAAWDAL